MLARPPERIATDGVVLRRHRASDVAALVAAVNEAGQEVEVSRPTPAPRSAADVTILNVEPGGY